MKDINYDLIALLHGTLDTIQRLEQYYIKDAQDAKCHSLPALKAMLEQEKKHAQILADEIQGRCQAKIFD